MANTNHFELKKTKTPTKNHRLRDDKLRPSHPQELRSSAISNGREKLDNVKPFCYGDHRGVVNSEELNMPREHESLPQHETVFDLRKSLAWDSAFFTSPGVLDPEELLGTVEVGVSDNPTSVFGPRENVYLPSDESVEPEITSRIGKCNLRRSLAWDSAFLTDAGVLDPDELCIINRGLKKSKTRGLPGIERLHRSVDSGCFSLESLEYELFEVARKARQKGKVSNVASSRCRKGIASKKLNVSSCSRMMSPMIASSKQPVNMHGPLKTTKETSGHPHGLQTARSVELNPSSLKPPKIVQRVSSIPVAPSKRATLGTKHTQVEDNSTKDTSSQHVTVSKKQCLRNPLNVISISAPLPKTPRLGSSTPKKEFVDCGVRDGTTKSPLSSLSRNPHCRSAVSGSTLSFPARYPPRNKPDSSNSSQQSCLLPLPKSSSSASLASSLDVLSSESSSPTLKSQKSSICQKNLSTSYSSLEFFPDTDATRTSNMGELPQLKTSPDLTDISRKLRPSGLRKPSPKLGYFYGMSFLSPTGVLQYQCDTKNSPIKDATRSCDLERDTDILKHTKRPAARTSMGTGRTKTGVLSPLSVRTRNLNQLEGENASSSGPGTLKIQKVGTAEHGLGTNPKVKTRGTERLLKSKLQKEEKGQVCGGTRKQHLKRHAESNLQRPNLREKENLFSFEDHVNSLSNHIGAFDLGVM